MQIWGPIYIAFISFKRDHLLKNAQWFTGWSHMALVEGRQIRGPQVHSESRRKGLSFIDKGRPSTFIIPHYSWDTDLIPGSGRAPGGGNGNPCLYSWLGNPMERAAWWATYSPRGHKESNMTEHTHTTSFLSWPWPKTQLQKDTSSTGMWYYLV